MSGRARGGPRIRTLKPETWNRLARLHRDVQHLFVVLITVADDEGRFLATPGAIIGHGYPADKDAPRKLEDWFNALEHERMVYRWVADDGLTYGWLPGWHEHQRINKPKPSVLPAPPLKAVPNPDSITDQDVTAA